MNVFASAQAITVMSGSLPDPKVVTFVFVHAERIDLIRNEMEVFLLAEFGVRQ